MAKAGDLNDHDTKKFEKAIEDINESGIDYMFSHAAILMLYEILRDVSREQYVEPYALFHSKRASFYTNEPPSGELTYQGFKNTAGYPTMVRSSGSYYVVGSSRGLTTKRN